MHLCVPSGMCGTALLSSVVISCVKADAPWDSCSLFSAIIKRWWMSLAIKRKHGVWLSPEAYSVVYELKMNVKGSPFFLHPPDSISFHYQSLFCPCLDLISSPLSENKKKAAERSMKSGLHNVSAVIFYHYSTSKEWFSSFHAEYFSFTMFPWPLLPLTLILPPLPPDLQLFEVCCGTLPSYDDGAKSLGNVKAEVQKRFKPMIIYKNQLSKENRGQENKQNTGTEWGGISAAFSWPLQCFRCALVFFLTTTRPLLQLTLTSSYFHDFLTHNKAYTHAHESKSHYVLKYFFFFLFT